MPQNRTLATLRPLRHSGGDDSRKDPMVTQGLAALEAQVRRDRELTRFPEPEWVPAITAPDGSEALDVLIVGAGQGGQAVAAALQRERVGRVMLIDRAPAGAEGIWRGLARMITLRTWKTVTGPDLGLPSLTFQSWYEAQHGAAAFEALGKIPKETWHDYLLWVRFALGLDVRNGVELLRLQPTGPLIAATVRDRGHERTLFARKVVLAMGIAASGRWWMPLEVEALPHHLRAHTADPINFAALRGKCVAVLGAGASAFDNAATALEAGAGAVHLFCRRPELQRVQPYKAISNPGFLRHFSELDDAWRWRFMRYLLAVREALPRETWDRCTRHPNFHVHIGAPWERLEVQGHRVIINPHRHALAADFLICGTGFEMDIARRRELAGFTDSIATWADRYTPSDGEENERLARYPYLGPGFELLPKRPGDASFLRHIHVFDFGTTMSFGPSGSSINGMKFAAPRLAHAITRDLFCADVQQHYDAMLAYQVPEFPLTFARDAEA
jgi:cation diffusion facilitator CzcD-associated flavoprotein CzcO